MQLSAIWSSLHPNTGATLVHSSYAALQDAYQSVGRANIQAELNTL